MTGALLGRVAPAIILLLGPAAGASQLAAQVSERRVVVESAGWQLVGDLTLPPSAAPVAGVLLLNKADGDRSVYVALVEQLASRGIASLRLDLRGHGESTNLGRFVPGEQRRDPLIWDAEADVVAAQRWMSELPEVDPARMAVVGASYSGEEMAEAGRQHGYAAAYVALSPGSFEDISIEGIDLSRVPWLMVVSREERFLQEIAAAVRERSATAELVILPGRRHATDLLTEHPGLSERIAVWLAAKLSAS